VCGTDGPALTTTRQKNRLTEGASRGIGGLPTIVARQIDGARAQCSHESSTDRRQVERPPEVDGVRHCRRRCRRSRDAIRCTAYRFHRNSEPAPKVKMALGRIIHQRGPRACNVSLERSCSYLAQHRANQPQARLCRVCSRNGGSSPTRACPGLSRWNAVCALPWRSTGNSSPGSSRWKRVCRLPHHRCVGKPAFHWGKPRGDDELPCVW
jgi:hypothetical protein